MNPAEQLFFVYGTLRPGGRYWPNVATYVADYEPAFAEGFALWHLPEGYPAVETGDGIVFGDLLYLRAGTESEALEIMDDIEGYRPDDETSLFERIGVNATRLRADASEKVMAQMYVYQRKRRDRLRSVATRVESGDWREFVARSRLES